MKRRSIVALLGVSLIGAFFTLSALLLIPSHASAGLATSAQTDTGSAALTPTPSGTPGCSVDWRVVSSPNPGPLSNWLNGVAATSPSDAWAVGNYVLENGYSRKTLIEHWNGARWNVVPSPNYGADTLENELAAVSALAPNDVWAVGWHRGPFAHTHTLIEHWDGNKWSIVPSPDGDSGSNYLNAVSAFAPDDIWAVGYSDALNSIYPQTLALHWNGSQWDLVPTPNVNALTNVLNGVTAIAKDDAWSVGYYYDPDANTGRPLMQHWDGTQWTIVPNSDSGVYGVLHGVFGLAANDVWAAGYKQAPGEVDQTLLQHWDGSSWSVSPSPNIGSGANLVYDLTGTAPNDVWAAGYAFDGNGDHTLIEHWDGSTWTILPSPSPGSLINDLRGVAAVSSDYVWVVGTSLSSGGETETVVERYRNSCAPPVPTNTPLPTPKACTVPPFSDVPVGSPFYPYITCLSCQSAISGYSDGTFRPGNDVTRGQLTKIVVLARGWPIDTAGGPHFSDVAPDHPFYSFIETAYNHQVISGYEDGTFRPGNNITRGQLAKVISLAAGFHGLPGFQVFEDVPPDQVFFEYVQMLGIRQVMAGYRCTSGSESEPCVPPYERKYFRPGNNATRAQTSKIIANAFFPDCGSSSP